MALKGPAELSQQTRLVTLCREEGFCLLGSKGEAGRHPVEVMKGEGGEENKPSLKFGFHLRQRVLYLLNCTRPLCTDTTQTS